MTAKTTTKKELSGRVAFVTGGSRGIGFAIAESMAVAGASVAICGREAKDLKRALARLQKMGTRCRAYVADANDPKQVRFTLGRIKKDFKHLDVLVNNIGGVKQFSNFEGLTDAAWQEVFDLNLMSAVRFSRAAFPLLRAGKNGRIVNIASVAGKRPGNFNPHYGAMKAAMIYLSKYLSNQWARYGILVNAIAPHTVKSGVWDRDVANKAAMFNLSFKRAEKQMEEEVASKNPLHGIALPEDVAQLAVFLASDKARFITGTCISVDGGAVNSIF